MKVSILAIASVVGLYTTPVKSQKRVKLRAGMTWSNIAWGFTNMNHFGYDETDGSDVIFLDMDTVNRQKINEFKKNGHIVSCYLSVGTLEPERSDYKRNRNAWKAVTVGKQDGWEEQWLDIQKPDALMKLMTPRLERAKYMGCDIVECDNVDCYENPSCFKPLGFKDDRGLVPAQLKYLKMLSNKAHSLGLAILSKNAVGLQPTVWSWFDGCITESCIRYSECKEYNKWCSLKNKPHFNADYLGEKTCPAAAKFPLMKTKWCYQTNNSLCSRTRNDEWRECWTEEDQEVEVKDTCGRYNGKPRRCKKSNHRCYYNEENSTCEKYAEHVCQSITKRSDRRRTPMCKRRGRTTEIPELLDLAEKCRRFEGESWRCNGECTLLSVRNSNGERFCVPSKSSEY